MVDLDSRLIQLENAQLVRRLAEEEPAFIFKHALTQAAAYESLLLKRRGEIHRLVAQSCERIYADRLDEFAAVLALHYDQAGDRSKALQYSIRAGDAAVRLYAHAEAIAHYSRALELARPDTAEARPPDLLTGEQLLHLYVSRGRALELSGRYIEALANYDEMEKEGVERQDGALKLAALMEQAKLYVVPNPNRDPARGKALTLQALAVARDLNDRTAQAKILWNLMLSDLYGGGDLDEAVANGERSLALARELELREQTAFTMNDLGIAYANYGDLGRALALLEESRALWRALGNLPMLTDNLGNSAVLYFYRGDYDEAVRFSDEGFGMSQAFGHKWGEAHTRFLIGDVYLERGESGKAIELMEAAIRAGEEARNPGVQIGTRADLAWALGSMGAVRRGIDLAQFSQRVARAGFDLLRTWPLAVMARLYLLEGNLDEAEQAVKESLEGLTTGSLIAPMLVRLAAGELALAKHDYSDALRIMDDLIVYLDKRSYRPFVADALYLRAQALLGQGLSDEALEILKRARGEAEALGSRRMLWQILALSGDIESQRGNENEARKLREHARESVSYIAGHAPPDLKDSFLQLPRIQALMAA